MKLLFLRNFREDDKKKLVDNLSKYYNLVFPEDNDKTYLEEQAKDADVILGLTITENIIKNATNAKLFQVPGAGVDRLNLDLFKNTDIQVCNSHSNSYFVAEHAFSLCLDLVKKITFHHNLMKTGTKPPQEEIYTSDSLKSKTIGILGYGNIGQKIAKFFQPFETNIIHYDKFSSESTDLKDVLKNSDYLFITLPLTPETTNFITKEQFDLMKSSACIINVARAKIINQEDLFNALKNNTILAAAIDVWYDDYNNIPSTNYPFHKLPNIILSPYRAAHAQLAPHLDQAIENLINFAQGKELINKIDLEKGY